MPINRLLFAGIEDEEGKGSIHVAFCADAIAIQDRCGVDEPETHCIMLRLDEVPEFCAELLRLHGLSGVVVSNDKPEWPPKLAGIPSDNWQAAQRLLTRVHDVLGMLRQEGLRKAAWAFMKNTGQYSYAAELALTELLRVASGADDSVWTK